MAITGKVRTLFTDKTQSEALFPKTKVSAISDENGVGLDSILSEMIYTGDVIEDATGVVNADTLGGRPASDFPTANEVIYTGENEDTDLVPLNADTLGGIPADEYATENFVAVKIAEAQMGGGSGGDIDLSGYATKDDVSNAIRTIDYPVDSVNGKTGAVQLNAEEVGAAPTNHDHNHIVVAGVNSDWRNAPNGISMWKYEGADTTALNLPHPHCFVHVMKESAGRGIAIAYKWDFGVCTMWNNSLHDTWRGWTIVHGSGNSIVPIANGGTDANTKEGILSNLHSAYPVTDFIATFGSGFANGGHCTPSDLMYAMGVQPVALGGTGATSLAGALQAMFPDSGTSKYIPMFGSNWENRKFATPTELKTAMGINSYFNAYGASGTDELTALKNNWPAIAVGAFILFTILSSGYRTFVGVKVDNNNGAVLEISYGSGSIYKYRLNSGTWTEHVHNPH